jgi:uncharacterized protein (DUF983 family)
MLIRGLIRRCPVCAERAIFTGYFRLRETCPRCGLRFARLEGHWSGDIGINTIISFTLLYVVLLGGTLVMWGDVNVALLGALTATVAVVFPIAFVPFAKTLWVAIDLAMRPLEPGEINENHREDVKRDRS